MESQNMSHLVPAKRSNNTLRIYSDAPTGIAPYMSELDDQVYQALLQKFDLSWLDGMQDWVLPALHALLGQVYPHAPPSLRTIRRAVGEAEGTKTDVEGVTQPRQTKIWLAWQAEEQSLRKISAAINKQVDLSTPTLAADEYPFVSKMDPPAGNRAILLDLASARGNQTITLETDHVGDDHGNTQEIEWFDHNQIGFTKTDQHVGSHHDCSVTNNQAVLDSVGPFTHRQITPSRVDEPSSPSTVTLTTGSVSPEPVAIGETGVTDHAPRTPSAAPKICSRPAVVEQPTRLSQVASTNTASGTKRKAADSTAGMQKRARNRPGLDSNVDELEEPTYHSQTNLTVADDTFACNQTRTAVVDQPVTPSKPHKITPGISNEGIASEFSGSIMSRQVFPSDSNQPNLPADIGAVQPKNMTLAELLEAEFLSEPSFDPFFEEAERVDPGFREAWELYAAEVGYYD